MSEQKISMSQYLESISRALSSISLPVSLYKEANVIARVVESLEGTRINIAQEAQNTQQDTNTTEVTEDAGEVVNNATEDVVKSDSTKAIEYQQKKAAKK